MCALARRGIMSQATALGARMCQSTCFVLWQEGRRMFFIGGISSGVKPLEYLKTVICGRCGAYGRYQDTGTIPQIHENNAAFISALLNPAHNGYFLTDLRCSYLCTSVGTLQPSH